MAEQEGKRDIEMVERTTTTDEQMPTSKGENPLMRSKEDDLSIWYSALRFKRVGCIAMIAAFCAALDGYRKTIASQRIQSADLACPQKSTSMAALSLTRDSSSSSPPPGQQSF
jgi:hypothetical protein